MPIKPRFPLAILIWWGISALWGIVVAWLYRDFMNPDGVTYLDLASAALANGPRGLVNGYWSPLYSALIALWELVTRPSPIHEFVSVHALNAIIYFAAAVSVGFFLRELILLRAPERGDLSKHAAFITLGFALFFFYLNINITPFAITPDILVGAIQFAAAALFFRIVRGEGRLSAYIGLGVVLAAGYYAKAIMLPAGLVLLGLLFFCQLRAPKNSRNVVIAAIAMMLLCAPQIIAVSQLVGHASISETGKLNYLWFVEHIRLFAGWTGTPGGDMPAHGPRVLMTNPEVLEFGQPIGGTYPLWFDPAYWYAGAKTHFTLKNEWAAFRFSVSYYDFRDLLVPLIGLVAFGGLTVSARQRPGRFELWFLLWPLSILFMYALVLAEHRYVAASLVLFWTCAYSAFLHRNGKAERTMMSVLAAVLVISGLFQFQKQYRALSLPGNATVATDLNQIGIQAGDPIATVGEGFSHHYARLARVRIVAQITNEPGFWSLAPDQAVEVERAIAGTGAKVLLGRARPADFQSERWRVIPGTSYSAMRLNDTGD